MKHLLSTLLLFLGVLALVPACSGGGSGSGGVTADVLIGDAPVDDLLSFSAVVQSVRLQRDDLTFTADLVSSLEVEFLGLNGALVFLAHGRIPEGTYVAMEIGFTAGQYKAKRGSDSADVVIAPTANLYLATLPVPLVVANGDYARFTADLDLLTSLSGDAGTGSLAFSPSGSSSSDDGSEDAPIDELKGPVQSADLVTRLVVVDGFVGPSSSIHLGNIEVHVSDTAVLLDNDNMTLTVGQFFTAAAPGTFLEVHGNLSLGGMVEATRIEIEDGLGGGGGGSIVRIEGILTSVGSSDFSMLIRRIKDGESIAQPIIDELADPNSLDVTFSGSTLFVFDTGGVTDSNALQVGQEVKVRFSTFSTSPFPATEVEIDDTPGFHGELVAPAGQGHALRLRLADAPGASALAADDGNDLSLELGSAPIHLKMHGEPALEPADLRAGLRVEPHGRVDRATSTLRVERLLVRPGFLEGARPASPSAAAGDFVVDGGRFVDPFGNEVTPGPLRVRPVEGCEFLGDASSAAEFFERLGSGVPAGATLDVFGLGDGTNAIRAYALRLRLN